MLAMRGRLLALPAALAVLVGVLVPVAQATPPGCPATGSASNPICFSWQGDWVQQAASVPSYGDPSKSYAGEVFTPTGAPAGLRPAVALLHGLSGRMEQVWWHARDLAGHGLVAITVTNTGTSADSFADAMRSMEAYLKAHSGALSVDTARVGLAGHSAGARAASLVQQEPSILQAAAVVGLDNLTSNTVGDAGNSVFNPSCTAGALPGTAITPRAPGLGIASDAASTTCPSNRDPDQKKAAWSVWRGAGKPTVEVVEKGTNHLSFAQTATTTVDGGEKLRIAAYFARTWFERWLKLDPAATDRLFDPRAGLGARRDSFLSTTYHSAAYLPDRSVDCASFAEAACALTP